MSQWKTLRRGRETSKPPSLRVLERKRSEKEAKASFLRVLESMVTDSGLASPPSSSYRCKDRPLAFSFTSTSKTHSIALQERWIHLRSKRNSFHTAFQVLQDQSFWPNLVDLSKNWRETHDKKDSKFASNAGKSLLALSGPITSS